ncbi:MAG: Nif3-like dinuclear metal center hexameric protein [Campylobacterales bacterium]|nr:Nif3-like dinuclear metal center hexameric protein [Campylobacterales bacterium]
MKLQEIYDHLDKVSPFELQEKWDNSGILIGDRESEISKVVLSIDLDEELLRNSDEGVLFIVHHPLIFSGLKSLDFATYPAKLIKIMIERKQSLIAMHTNFDKTHLNRYVFEEILDFSVDYFEDFICTTQKVWQFNDLIRHLKSRLDLEQVKVVNPKDEISSIALTTGSGASMMDRVEADCYLTGDIKYHDAIKAKEQNLMMIDIGHYESEKFFGEVLKGELENLPLLAIISNSKNPFYSLG